MCLCAKKKNCIVSEFQHITVSPAAPSLLLPRCCSRGYSPCGWCYSCSRDFFSCCFCFVAAVPAAAPKAFVLMVATVAAPPVVVPPEASVPVADAPKAAIPVAAPPVAWWRLLSLRAAFVAERLCPFLRPRWLLIPWLLLMWLLLP
jgi:hypothetical protein